MAGAIFVCSGILSVSAINQESLSSTPYQFATKFLSEYYNAIDQYDSFNFSDYIDLNNLLTYVNNKVESKRYKSVVYGTDDMQNYKLSFTLKNSEIINDYIKLTISAETKFNYKNANLNSGYSQINQIIISNDNDYKIVDWYISSDSYDMQLRGDMLNISNCDYWNINTRILTNINQKQQNLNNKIKQYYDDLKVQSKWTEDNSVYSDNAATLSTLTSTRSTLYSLNRSNMVTWANNNCSENNPSSGNSNQVSSYYDFSSIPYNYDCTNFVSHALLAGGAVVYDTGNSGISSTGWYFRDINNRSSSWSGVSNLYNFLTSNTTKGPAGSYLAYSSIYAPSGNFPYQSGDILQFHNGSIWRHSTLITGYTYLSGSSTTLEAIVTGRSCDGQCNYNQRQSEIYPGCNRRVIKMAGYYK